MLLLISAQFVASLFLSLVCLAVKMNLGVDPLADLPSYVYGAVVGSIMTAIAAIANERAKSARRDREGADMDIDEGMVVTVEELGMKFVVTDIVGDYASDYTGRRVYHRIDSVKLVPLRELIESEAD